MTSEPKVDKPRRNLPLYIGFGISAAWLLFFLIYWVRNLNEIANLVPNNFGDFLAGVFAPLAFLWLFVATLLQRQELELQRQELAETREVLALQKEELKRAADETSHQTKIMTENLVADRERKLYEEIDTRLYSLALYIVSNRNQSTVEVGRPSRGILTIITFHHEYAASINRSNFDRTYLLMFNAVESFVSEMGKYNAFKANHPNGKAFFEYLHGELTFIARTKRHLENDQIRSRLQGLQIPQMLAHLDGIGNQVYSN